jgi:hypothetical protein
MTLNCLSGMTPLRLHVSSQSMQIDCPRHDVKLPTVSPAEAQTESRMVFGVFSGTGALLA